MLQISVMDSQHTVTEQELDGYLHRNAQVLDRACAGEEKYSDSLGWVRVDEWAGREVMEKTRALAAAIRDKADAFVLIGVGGSNNASRAVIEALSEQTDGPEIIYSGNTLSANAMNQLLKKLEGKDIYIDCIAKNFETLEPGASFRLLRQYLVKKYGRDEATQRILCTGTIGSNLERLCEREGYTFLPFATDVGGRYSALTYVHLLPMAVAGIDIGKLVAGAKAMEAELHSTGAMDNTALRYAALRNLYYQKGYRVELLSSFEPQWRWFYEWWKQLFAESEGKDNRGLLPVTAEFSEQLHSLGQFIQDGSPILFETFLDIRDQQDSLIIGSNDVEDGFDYLNGKDFWTINKTSFEATRASHSEKLPCLTLQVERLDAEQFGALFYFFEFACYLSGSLLGVDPFDQPGVEEYKKRMFRVLKK